MYTYQVDHLKECIEQMSKKSSKDHTRWSYLEDFLYNMISYMYEDSRTIDDLCDRVTNLSQELHNLGEKANDRA